MRGSGTGSPEHSGQVMVKVYMIKMMGPMVMLILVTFSGDADIDIDY